MDKLRRRKNAKLVYNTGRPLSFVEQYISKGTLLPVDFIIANQGHNIYYRGTLWEPWVNFMQSVQFTPELLASLTNHILSIDVSPCTVNVVCHDFCMRWWVKGGGSLSDCARAYHCICDAVPVSGLYWLNRYSQAQIEKDFGTSDWFEKWGIGCDLCCIYMKNSKAPAAQFLLDHFAEAQAAQPLAIWAGDGDNDIGMLSIDALGIIVNNACLELKEASRNEDLPGRTTQTTSRLDVGVIEGLQFFGPIAGEVARS